MKELEVVGSRSRLRMIVIRKIRIGMVSGEGEKEWKRLMVKEGLMRGIMGDGR